MPHFAPMVKRVARRFGLDVSRSGMGDVFHCWLTQLQRTGPVRVVFDVGANRGQTVTHLRRDTPDSTIYCFEPSESAFAQLRERTAGDPDVKAIQVALGDYDGTAMLHENAADVTNSLLANSSRISDYAPQSMCAPKHESTVPIMRIDSPCEEQRITRIDLLKVDAQGSERRILDGAGCFLKPSVTRSLIVEVLFAELYENQAWCGEIMELLRSRGYRLFGFTGVACDPIYGWKWADAMFLGDCPMCR